MKLIWTLLGALALPMTMVTPVDAHTTLRGSSPASGSVLTQAPPQLTLTFLEPARLTSLVLVTASGERKLAFTPTGSGLTFTSHAPPLRRGRNEVRWTALSQDGHVIEGSIIIVLRAPG